MLDYDDRLVLGAVAITVEDDRRPLGALRAHLFLASFVQQRSFVPVQALATPAAPQELIVILVGSSRLTRRAASDARKRPLRSVTSPRPNRPRRLPHAPHQQLARRPGRRLRSGPPTAVPLRRHHERCDGRSAACRSGGLHRAGRAPVRPVVHHGADEPEPRPPSVLGAPEVVQHFTDPDEAIHAAAEFLRSFAGT